MAVALYVGNLAESITASVLYEKFKSIGDIASIYVCRNKEGCSRGYGYINFKKSADGKFSLFYFFIFISVNTSTKTFTNLT